MRSSVFGVVSLLTFAIVVSGFPVSDRQDDVELISTPTSTAQLESYSAAPITNEVDQPPLNEENIQEERRDREKEYFESEIQGETQNVAPDGSSSPSYVTDDSSSGLFLAPSSPAEPSELFAPDTQQQELIRSLPEPDFGAQKDHVVPQQAEIEPIQPVDIQPAAGCPELSPENECVLGAPEVAPDAQEIQQSAPVQQEAADAAPAPVERLEVVCQDDDCPTDSFQVMHSPIDPAPAPVEEKTVEK